jgi:hypothetical protein
MIPSVKENCDTEIRPAELVFDGMATCESYKGTEAVVVFWTKVAVKSPWLQQTTRGAAGGQVNI